MTTLSDVAERAGVSISAVSKVLGGAPVRVSEQTRQRILDAARELQYRPNFAARALRASRTKVIGLVVPDLTNALFTELMHGAEDEAAEHGYTVLLGRTGTIRPYTEVIARLLGEGRVDGMVVQVGDGVAPAGLTDVLDPSAALVLINSAVPGRVASVALDDAAGAATATRHLIELGHTRIAFANGLAQSFTAKRRRVGYRDAMAGAGLTVPRGYETRLGYTEADGKQALHRLMELRSRPTGIVVANVNAAIGLIAEARALGIAVPTGLSVVSVHDSWTAENTWPPLTAVRMQFYAMGRTAVAGVIRRIETGAMSDEVITSPAPELIVRESTAAPRG